MRMWLVALTLTLAGIVVGGTAWWAWNGRDSALVASGGAAVRVELVAPGLRRLRSHTAEGWHAVVRRQLERQGWSLTREHPPVLPLMYQRVTELGPVAMSETAVVRAGAKEVEVTLRWRIVWRGWSSCCISLD